MGGGGQGFSGFRDPFSVFETFFGGMPGGMPGASFRFSTAGGPGGAKFARTTGNPFAGFSQGATFFGDDFDFDHGGNRNFTGRKRKAETITQPFSCSLEDLYNGCTKKMKFTRRVTDGRGATTTQDRILDIVVKPGWKAGTKVTFHNEGDVTPGVEPADICFVLEEEPHPFFKREGNDLVYVANITLAQAFSGVKLTIRGLNGQQHVACIRDIVHPKYEHRIPGAGMPVSKSPGSYGDLIVRFDIRFPTQMNVQDRNQIKQIIVSNM